MRNGTPRNGPLGRSALAAVSRAWSNHRITTALRAGVDAFDALDRRLEQLARRHLARRDERRLIGGIHPTGLIGECRSWQLV